jgi:hypothetical protein
MNDLLQIDRFRHWLEHHCGDDIVGFMGDPDQCPLAVYLHERGHPVCVGTSVYGVPGRELIALPDWAIRFSYHIDGTEDHNDDEITARRAIVCMMIVAAEMSSMVDPAAED